MVEKKGGRGNKCRNKGKYTEIYYMDYEETWKTCFVARPGE